MSVATTTPPRRRPVDVDRSADVDEIRELDGAEEITQAWTVFRTAMVGIPFPDGGDAAGLHEPGRTLGAIVDGRVVGAAESYTSWLTVPGGARVAHAAVTHVGVLPSHTRRGIATEILRQQLADVARRGDVVASLRASEATIYERFGYGIASRSVDYELARRRATLRDTVDAGGPVRVLQRAQAGSLPADIYRRAAWTGSIDRPQYWWRGRELWATATPGPSYVVIHGEHGGEDGYAIYHPIDTSEWFTGRDRTVVVDDFVAHTRNAYLGLVRHFACLDLVDTVRLPNRPLDDPLPSLFVDARAVRSVTTRDETWLRLVDVTAALTTRTYRPADTVVIEVEDPLLTGNAGRYRIDGEGARPTTEPADLSVDVSALASVYLGGLRWSALELAGRAVEHRSGALSTADELFATVNQPFAGTGF